MPEIIVKSGIPEMDDCKILTRLKAFIVDQGVCATLEHVFRNKTGNSIDLSAWLASGVSESGSVSSSTSPSGTVVVRVKEWLGSETSPAHNPIWEIAGVTVDAAAGKVRATLEAAIVEHSAIYELNWAVLNSDGRPVIIDRGLMSVEKSMFAIAPITNFKGMGPPTIQEVRMRLMDSSANENLLLDDVEFKDEQIMMAMWEPIRFWNESPPPLRPLHTTRTFPHRGAWITGILAQLHMMAANHYRRNVYRGAPGGTSDKDKEREYMAEGTRLWGEYQGWVLNRKVADNMKLFGGNAGSAYGGGAGF